MLVGAHFCVARPSIAGVGVVSGGALGMFLVVTTTRMLSPANTMEVTTLILVAILQKYYWRFDTFF